MFKHKDLKQLQEVQAQIKNLTANISNLKPPIPCSYWAKQSVCSWLIALVTGNDSDIRELTSSRRFWEPENEDPFDYLSKLGQYFIDISRHYKDTEKYKKELEQLKIKERKLKDKLGIN